MDFFSKQTHINVNIDIKLPWVEKYRPKNSEEILLEPFIKHKINKILGEEKEGSGYINPGPDGKSTYKQVADGLFPKFNPAFIVIEGGQNDVATVNAAGADMATEMSAAACDLYASIRKNYPKVKLIVMTPFYGVSQAPPVVGVQESAIKECAAKYNAKVISGVRKWLQDQPELFITDQTHPNGKGHALIAKKFLAWFKANKF